MKVFRKVLLSAAIIGLLSSLCPLQAPANEEKEADWILTLQTEELKGVLDFKGSRHKNPVKVHVTYQDTQLPADKKVVYEDFWYNDQGLVIGQEKHHVYDIRPNEQIIFHLDHKNEQSVTEKENLAAAEATLRVYLDAVLHRGAVTGIRVKAASFNQVEQALENLQFTPYQVPPQEVAGNPKMLLYLSSDPIGQSVYLERN